MNKIIERFKKIETNTQIILAIFVILFGLSFVLDNYWLDVINNVGLYAILALSLNIILGSAGLFHMGHAAFYAIGAYLAAILNVVYGVPLLWSIPLCGLLAGLVALIVARPIIHLRGDYLLIVTIGVVEIIRIALVNDVLKDFVLVINGIMPDLFSRDFIKMVYSQGITGGSNGVFGISRPNFFGYIIKSPQDFFYLIFGFTAITIFLFKRLENSRFGRALIYLKEDDVAAEGSGINTTHYKLVAFVLGAVWAGMAGNLFAAKMTIINPDSFNFEESVVMFTIVILGGSGSILGVVVGAFLIIGLPEVFRELESARMLIFGLAMIVMMIFRSEGLIPPLPQKYKIPGFRNNNRNGGEI
ncbi:MAG: branched-chain amino acid ABC transporter permease [Desulfobacterales bacterium]|nr:branched-chain amino acid ABC transporter permease [Desulfobacterales bacterium]MCP4158569.1 branched-chain amino acid ABC transporter permease [Deltaproteobacteria bacterium]